MNLNLTECSKVGQDGKSDNHVIGAIDDEEAVELVLGVSSKVIRKKMCLTRRASPRKIMATTVVDPRV